MLLQDVTECWIRICQLTLKHDDDDDGDWITRFGHVLIEDLERIGEKV